MTTTPAEETSTAAAGRRYPAHVMATVSQRAANGEILIPWNAPRSAIVEGVELLYYSYRYLTDFYPLDASPHAPIVLVFGLTGDGRGEPPRPHSGQLVLTRGVLRDEILDALDDHGYPFLLWCAVDTDAVTLMFGATRATDTDTTGGEGTTP